MSTKKQEIKKQISWIDQSLLFALNLNEGDREEPEK